MAGVQVGIANGPGLGRELARWMVHGETEVSVRGYDARRFGFVAADDAMHYGQVKGTEDYEYRHQTPLPGLEHPELRPYRITPLYERCADKGAVFTQVYGWERPKWYPTVAGLPQQDVVAFRHTDWFGVVSQECRAVRERVGLLDSTAFAKFDLVGPDAAAVLDQPTTNTLPKVGRIALSYFLTPTGRIEGEATITRLADDHYMISRDLTHDVGPDEAGLQRFVKVDKGHFVGRGCIAGQAETGRVRRTTVPMATRLLGD